MKQPKDRIIFPLDVSHPEDARRYVRLLAGRVGLFKVGLELFIRCGPEIVREVRETGRAGVFLDLKLHDIPATVGRAMRRVAELGATFATVHCSGGTAMLAAAVAGSEGRVNVLGVTVLTSLATDDLTALGIRSELADDIAELAAHRAAMARRAGCAGVICSGREAAVIKARCGHGFLAVTPGIRPRWRSPAVDDQRRVTTPAEAVRNGADYLVIGRPIRDAGDPAAAADRIADEIAGALSTLPSV